MARLLALKEKSPAGWMKMTDPVVAERSLRAMIDKGEAYMVAGFLILAYEGTTWYSDEPILFEELILKVYDSCENVTVAVEALEYLARSKGCKWVVAGDTQIGYMLPFYKGAGYEAVGTQLAKEVHHRPDSEIDGGGRPD